MLYPSERSEYTEDISPMEGDEILPMDNPQLMLDVLNAKKNDPSAFVSGWMETDETGIVPDEDVDKHPDRKLLKAAEDGDLETAATLLSDDPTLVHARDRDQYTPLHRAAYGNHVAMIRLLLKHGADVGAKTSEGWQPLHCAARWGNLPAFKVLMHLGKADINARTNGNLTPLHLAASEPNGLYVAEYLLCQRDIDPTIRSNSGEMAKDIAKRTSSCMLELFEGTIA